MSLSMSLSIAEKTILQQPEQKEIDNSLIRKSLYDDSYLTVTDSGVLIKCFTFPNMEDKFIPFGDILKVEEESKALNFALWGFSLSGTYYACDYKRFMCSRNVDTKLLSLTLKSSYFRNGFTAVKGTKVLHLIRENII